MLEKVFYDSKEDKIYVIQLYRKENGTNVCEVEIGAGDKFIVDGLNDVAVDPQMFLCKNVGLDFICDL